MAEPDITWTYFLTRDSLNGELSATCSLWHAKPTRVRSGGRVTWVGTDPLRPGHLGEFKPQAFLVWFRVYPETDREIIRVDTRPNAAELEAAKKVKA